MKKTRNSFSLTLILTTMLLACLLFCTFSSTGAWFSSTGATLKFSLNVSGANIYVYQGETKLDASENSYITLSQQIVPGEEVLLDLNVKNNEPVGSYLRFKFEVYALGQTDVLIPVVINCQEITSSSNGFFEYTDGYFCYQKYESETTSTPELMQGNLSLISGFTIEESDFVSKALNGNTIKVIITVECSEINWYA